MIQIITDSSSLYAPDQAKAKGFYSLPLYVCADSDCYRDFEEIDPAHFTEMTKDAKSWEHPSHRSVKSWSFIINCSKTRKIPS